MKYSIIPESYLTFSNLIIVSLSKAVKITSKLTSKYCLFYGGYLDGCWFCCSLLLLLLSYLLFFLSLFILLFVIVDHFTFCRALFHVIRTSRQIEKHKIRFYFHLKTLSFLWRVILWCVCVRCVLCLS